MSTMPASPDHSASTRRRVVVAMSGGVDSSVAAALLREEGLDVIGVTLKLQDCREARASRSCCGVDGIMRARTVAGQLGIRHYVLDCVSEFERQVLRPAWEDYSHGRTPNPCLLCNERIKFAMLLSWARQLGAPLFATGHYARVERHLERGPALLRGVDPAKDQSYFLAGLTSDQLSSVVFPLGHLAKKDVRERARSLGLSTAETHDSQDACLVGEADSFAEMLRQRFGGECRPGPIVDGAGATLGRHSGIHHFTVGQRRGLSVASCSRRWVSAIRESDSAVVVTSSEAELYDDQLRVAGVSWIEGGIPSPDFRCEVQIRYRHVAEPATARARLDGSVEVTFERPVRAITLGQAAVFYDGTRALGRGWIYARG